jgi:hypothetical protein
MRLKSRFDRIERGGAHASVLGEPTDQDTIDATASKFIAQSGRVEGGIWQGSNQSNTFME